jgi:hypothetical protein
MIEGKNKNFILILFDIEKISEKSEYSFRIIKAVIEMPSPEFPEKY